MANDPRAHHYVPQFYLRNLAVDTEAKKLTTVAKHGHVAVWAQRSIESIGYERDLYVRMVDGVLVSSETPINQSIETLISTSDTWQKIKSGDTRSLERSDKPVLCTMIRHFEARTPHYRSTALELAQMAANPDSAMPFTDEERDFYALVRSSKRFRDAMMNEMAASLKWTERSYRGCGITVGRSPIPLRSSTIPVLPIRTPYHPSLYLPEPGMVPFQLVLILNPTTFATLVLGNFNDAFINEEVGEEVALGLNRRFVGQFGHFPHARHLITDRANLEEDMAWARYEVVQPGATKIKFRRAFH